MKFKISLVLSILTFTLLVSSCSILNKSKKDKNDRGTIAKSDAQFKFDYHLLEAQRLKLLGKYDEALRELERAKEYKQDEGVLFYELAEINSRNEYYSDAVKHAKKAIELEPENIWYHVLLSQLYQKSGLLADASEEMEKIIELQPDKLEYYFMLSSLYKSIGDPKEAVSTLDDAEDYFGITDIISVEKVKYYQAMGKENKAIKEMNSLIEEYPDNSRYKAILAGIYIENGEDEKAEKIYNDLEDAGQLDGRILLSISEFYRKNSNYKKAYDYLKKAFAAKDLNIDFKVEMLVGMITNTGNSHFEKSKQKELFEIFLNAHPGEPKALTVYSDFLVKIEENDKAIKIIKKVLKDTRDKYVIWEQLLYLFNQEADFKSLYAYSDTVTGLFPFQPMPYLYGSMSALRLDSVDKTIEFAKKGVNYTTDNPDIKAELLTFLGEAYHKNEEYNKADSVFDKVIEMEPENVYVLNNYAYYLSLRKEKLEKARNMGKRLIRLSPNNSTYLDTYAWVLYELGEYKNALEYIKQAYQNGGSKSPVIVEHYGDILYKNDQKDKALQKWKEALELKPKKEKLQKKVETGKLVNE